MTPFRAGLAANFVGAAWTGGLQLVCAPLFIRLMGVESYGLIGFYLTLLAALQVLDCGFSPTVNRELARGSARADGGDRDLIWTLQILYLGAGLALGAAVIALAPAIASRWIAPGALGADRVAGAIRIMGLLVAAQWPITFFQSALVGMQRLVPMNAIRVAGATLAYGGAVVALVTVSNTIETFVRWQALVAALQLAALIVAVWRYLPAAGRAARFDFARVRAVIPFAREMAAIAIAGTAVAQLDKIVLSHYLPLEAFGGYVLAGVLASALGLFITPIYSAVFPRLAALVARGDAAGTQRLYHEGSQLMAVLVLSTATVLALFARQVLELWTGDAKLAAAAAPIAALLLAGTAINGLMHLPYALQLANGWTRLGLQFAAVKIAVYVPALVWAVTAHGAVGGAAAWAALNALYLAFGVPLTHRRVLPGDAPRWLLSDVAGPLAAVAAVTLAARALLPAATGLAALAELALAGGAALAAAVLAAPEVRALVLKAAWPQKVSSA